MGEPEAARPLPMPSSHEGLRTAATPQEVLEAFSPQELEEELRRRNAGAVAGEEGFLAGIEDYFNPQVSIDTASQLAIVSDFWIKLGYEVPILESKQQSQLEEAVEANPTKRVVPAPLMSLEERSTMVEEARHLPSIKPIGDADRVFALGTPQEWHNLYGKLLGDPESVVREGLTMIAKYGLRYKTPSGETASRKVYEGLMLEAGQAVEDDEGAIWTFPVMDVGRENTGPVDEGGNRVSVQANKLYEDIQPSSTPEALIAIEVLRRLGTDPKEDIMTTDDNEKKLKDQTTAFGNEFVYKLDGARNIKRLMYMASVVWNPGRRQISDQAWFRDIAWKHFGVRDTVSGISSYS